MNHFEFGPTQDYRERLFALRFRQGQVVGGQELSTVDFRTELSVPPSRIGFDAISPTARRATFDSYKGCIYTGAGVLFPRSLSESLDVVSGGAIQWIPSAIHVQDGASEAHSLLVPRKSVKALDLLRTEMVNMPGGGMLPIPPYWFNQDQLEGQVICRVELGPIVISGDLAQLLVRTPCCAVTECRSQP